MNGKNKKISFKLKKNDIRTKYYRSHFSDHPIIYYLDKNKLIVSLNVELYSQSLKKIRNNNYEINYLINVKNTKILNALQEVLNDYPFVHSIDLHLQECYPSLYYVISTKLKFFNKVAKPTKLICQNVLEGWDILGEDPKIVYGGRAFNHTSFCSFSFNKKDYDTPNIPKLINQENREERYYEKLLVCFEQENEKFLKAVPSFLEINRNPFQNEYLGEDYLYVTCRGIYIPDLLAINMHLERNTLIYVIDEIKNGKLFKFWLNNNSQKYIEYTKDSFNKYLKDRSYHYQDELGKTVYLVGDLNVLENNKDMITNNFPDAEIVKIEYLDWIVKGIKLGQEKEDEQILFL